MTELDQKLEIWRNKLLDLGKGNRLLNYKDTKRSNLRVVKPNIDDLWQSFVKKEESIEFDYFDDDENTLNDDISEVVDARKTIEASEVIDKRKVVTNQSIKEQQRTLRNLRDKAKTAMEEQGVNILYLSFGFLEWSESNHSEQIFLSPIVLVPVSLTIESITSPFILSLHEDEIVINPTLAYKLGNDFGMKLPEFNEDTGLQDYLEAVRALVAINKWEVTSHVGLGLFSFLKINMYRDLEINKDKALNHPVVRALNGDASALNISVTDINDFNHDRDSVPTEIFQVVDADSSQQDAVLLAKKGASFVLQGPPGTGKSQTITNIIAECLAHGKKVLFVSEKVAALEVVQRRLAKVGLDVFCLVLHSNKANKREILDQLANVLEMAEKKASLKEGAYQKLDLLQEYKVRLNDYADALVTNVLPLNKTIYEINGYIASLESYEEVIFKLDDILAVTDLRFNRMINLLNRFAEIAGEKCGDYKLNPWNGANVLGVSNELRHDIGANISKLLPKIYDAVSLYDQVEGQLHTEHPSSYNGLSDIADLLETAARSPKIPVAWILGDDITPLFSEIDEYAQAKETFSLLQAQLEQSYVVIKSQYESFDIEYQSGLFELSEIEKQKAYINEQITSNPLFNRWLKINNWDKIAGVFAETKQQITDYNAEKAALLGVFENEILDLDYKAIYARFKTKYTPFFKIFNSQYKTDKRIIKGLYKEIVKKISDDAIVSMLTTLRNIDEAKKAIEAEADTVTSFFGQAYQSESTDFVALGLQVMTFQRLNQCLLMLEELQRMAGDIVAQEDLLKQHYDFLYQGINTDWRSIHSSLNWASEFRKKVEKYSVGSDFITWICTTDEKIAMCGQFHAELIACLQGIDTEFCWFLDLFETQEEIKNTRMIALSDRLIACKDGLAFLEQWIDFRNARKDCQKEGLGDYIEKIDAMDARQALIIPMFKKRFYRLWLDAVLPKYPSVMNFRRQTQEELISDFATLDTLQFDIAKARIRKKLIDELPSPERFTSGTDEINILKRELGKKARIKPIRKLFGEIPNLLLTLKPCLMMSPLSVSLFLEADGYTFDTVIFDEASQVCTENAIGAILRGKQVIIAGDSKQLPPTNFFTANTSDADFDDDEEDDETDAYESILDEASMLPERTLLWHYRSRHEHLIAFSNAKIYKNNLITFPSNVDKIPDNGVEYIYAREGFYDRGGKKGNIIEAKKVAELVFEHFRKFPKRSLGVIAFGEVQQQAIDTVVRQMRKEQQEYEEFFNEDKSEAFFIKNLENVQGDERDTIIFSIGYAKDAAGKMQMIFGPLSKSGGERRLNVAITRAKYNVKLVGSILPTEIVTERISAEGPKLLRGYIDFAINGPKTLIHETTESDCVIHDSPFEEAVYNFLDRKGYKLGTQIGCSGYRIDMAVKHPTISGKYVLGIECDGASYHSARTARERDRLRQDILESMGWKIYRIWSTDWIKDPTTEGQRLVEAINKAISCYEDENADYFNARTSVIAEAPVEEAFLSLSVKEVASKEKMKPYGFGREVVTTSQELPYTAGSQRNLVAGLVAIVAKEFPIHYELIYRRAAHLLGNEKVTVKVRREVDNAFKIFPNVTRKGDFFYPLHYEKITPMTVGNTRSIEHISPDELAEEMLIIASSSVGAKKAVLYSETARAYGFTRRSDKVQEAMRLAYELILKSGKADEIEGKLFVHKNSL